ncbi:MAG: relaxase/mobilization nuclease domain-containing protein [Clostridia bacterium]|nr:relaxase/mobilization nuclease domain-containing protein [Clostridia bacterium]
MPDTSYQEMINVKKQFFKVDGIQCFHAVQSFVKGEITPEQAHEIGIKLAEELWGDKFQVVITTHLNTDNLHNHFILNSVSFLDGKRFCNTKKDYALMRKTSDRLCEEYGLNVLLQEEKYNKYATSSLYKELMKDSIDYAIESAKYYNEFIKILQDLGYVITDKNETLSIRRDPYKRNTRLERQFGNKYSKENIYKRILETQPLSPYSSNPMVLITRTYENYSKQKERHYKNKGSIGYLIYQYEKLFDINTESTLKSKMTIMTPTLIAELKQLDEFSNQARFLTRYNINTNQDLLNFERSAYEKVNPLKSKRENLWKKHKRAKTDKEKQVIENEIIQISKQITLITEEIKLCNNIMQRVEKIKEYQLQEQINQEKVQLEKEQEKNKKDKNKAR